MDEGGVWGQTRPLDGPIVALHDRLCYRAPITRSIYVCKYINRYVSREVDGAAAEILSVYVKRSEQINAIVWQLRQRCVFVYYRELSIFFVNM